MHLISNMSDQYLLLKFVIILFKIRYPNSLLLNNQQIHFKVIQYAKQLLLLFQIELLITQYNRQNNEENCLYFFYSWTCGQCRTQTLHFQQKYQRQPKHP